MGGGGSTLDQCMARISVTGDRSLCRRVGEVHCCWPENEGPGSTRALISVEAAQLSMFSRFCKGGKGSLFFENDDDDNETARWHRKGQIHFQPCGLNISADFSTCANIFLKGGHIFNHACQASWHRSGQGWNSDDDDNSRAVRPVFEANEHLDLGPSSSSHLPLLPFHFSLQQDAGQTE